jgi:hypothetical protein
MRAMSSSALALSIATAILLSACGGGSDEGVIVEEDEPERSFRSSTLTITGATDASLNGVYTTDNTFISDVVKVNPIGGDPELCKFRFEGQTSATTGRAIGGGDIRYIPGTNNLHVTFMGVAGTEFRMNGTTGATVDRANNEIDYTGAVFTSTQTAGQTITVTGSVPMVGNRPEGC